MDSKGSLPFAAGAAAVSGAAFYFGGGLYPAWWLVWIAALPVLLVAPRLRWPAAALTAFLPKAIGGLSMWAYYHRRIRLPLWLTLESILAPAVLFAIGVLLFRAFLRRGRPWLAALAPPCITIAVEYLVSLSEGTFGSTAYTQMNNVPVLQIGALAGLWGIGFAVLLFAPLAAVALMGRRSMWLAPAALLLCVFGYGGLRMRSTPAAPHSITVGLAASDVQRHLFPTTENQIMETMQAYAGQARALVARGARVVVLPEMVGRIQGPGSDRVDRVFQDAARETGAEILLGVLHATPGGTFNEARLYAPSGTIEVYRKQHLVPVLESGTTPANGISVLQRPYGTVGLEICRDMDYPDPARRYGDLGAGLLLVPAWDFDVDRWWHGRMALMRGVEYGYSIVRSVKLGLLTVSDDRGRILAEARTTPDEPFTTLLATVPVRHGTTLYQKWGDWFGWLSVAGALALAAAAFTGRRAAGSASG